MSRAERVDAFLGRMTVTPEAADALGKQLEGNPQHLKTLLDKHYDSRAAHMLRQGKGGPPPLTGEYTLMDPEDGEVLRVRIVTYPKKETTVSLVRPDERVRSTDPL